MTVTPTLSFRPSETSGEISIIIKIGDFSAPHNDNKNNKRKKRGKNATLSNYNSHCVNSYSKKLRGFNSKSLFAKTKKSIYCYEFKLIISL